MAEIEVVQAPRELPVAPLCIKVTMPRDALHYGNVKHRELHNGYGYYFHMATSDGLLKRGGVNDRPFVLSRAFFPRTQSESDSLQNVILVEGRPQWPCQEPIDQPS
ncbi:alpaa 1,3-glucosidase [Artemisia annua]|uniref:Alpaa 1,3-glucosidase n=1 Tax=Artemisia annua TaxID=35608 RepID=A0A2U1P0M7_ARTAN|nr:alpaa 1,3-glucosidase [Artemisia annua]